MHPLHSVETFFAKQQIEDDYKNLVFIMFNSSMTSNNDVRFESQQEANRFIKRIIRNKKILKIDDSQDIILQSRINLDFRNLIKHYPNFKEL